MGKAFLSVFLMSIAWLNIALAETYMVSTVVESYGYTGSYGIAIDGDGVLYVTTSLLIKQITPDGVVTTFAGSGYSSDGSKDGNGTEAVFESLGGITIDDDGNLYVTDLFTIRKVTPEGVVSTIAGGGATIIPCDNIPYDGCVHFVSIDGNSTEASFRNPRGITIDDNGSLYVAEQGANLIRKITPEGMVSTLAGGGGDGKYLAGFADGWKRSALFNNPSGIAIDSHGNLYVSDRDNNAIRKITPEGMVSTFAGGAGTLCPYESSSTCNAGSMDGTGTEASFNHPYGITIDNDDNLFVADSLNSKIRKITPEGVVSTIVGKTASFSTPTGITIDNSGDLYVTDGDNRAIRKITISASVTQSLKSGWNLIGNPAMNSFDVSNKADTTAIWIYDKGEWEKNPAVIDACKGFWVNTDIDGNLTYASSGCMVDASMVTDGWNLLCTGSPIYAPKEILEATTVWKYDDNWSKNPASVDAGSGFWVER